MSRPADRGKYAEKKVHDWLKKVDAQTTTWDFQRVSDARSAGGRGAKTVVGDFEFFAPGVHGVVEVKEIKHDFRVPAANITQLPKARKRMLAGGLYWIVVFHRTTNLWRRVSANDLEIISRGSWDLREYPTYERVEEALPLEVLGIQ